MSEQFDRTLAERLLRDYLPMIERLNEGGVAYCVVGGLGILIQAYARGAETFRGTNDLDILVPEGYSNQDFADDYLAVYASDPAYSEPVYDAVFGDGAYDALADGEWAYANISFVGASELLDGVSTPDFDVCRRLDARTASSIDSEVVVILGVPTRVATVTELLGMKRDTIAVLHASPDESSRIQDFQDVRTLEALVAHDARPAAATRQVSRRPFGR